MDGTRDLPPQCVCDGGHEVFSFGNRNRVGLPRVTVCRIAEQEQQPLDPHLGPYPDNDVVQAGRADFPCRSGRCWRATG